MQVGECPNCARLVDVLDDVIECQACGRVMTVADWEPLTLELVPSGRSDNEKETQSVRRPAEEQPAPPSSSAAGDRNYWDLLELLVDLVQFIKG